MKRLLSTTAALSLALAPVQPWPLMAQTLEELVQADDGSIVGPDGTVVCIPAEAMPCDLEMTAKALSTGLLQGVTDPVAIEQAALAVDAAEAQAQADAAAAAAAAEAQAAEAEAAAAAQAQADTDAAAAAAAAAVAQAQAEADAAAAAAAAQAQADADAAAAAAAAQAQADADAAAAAIAAQAQAEADAAAAAAAAQAQADEAAAAAAAAEAEAAAAEPTVEKKRLFPKAPDQTAEEVAPVAPAAEAEVAPAVEPEVAAPTIDVQIDPSAPVDPAATDPVVTAEPAANDTIIFKKAPDLAEEPVLSTEAEAALTAAAEAEAAAKAEAEAAAAAPAPAPVDAPVVTAEEAQTVNDLLSNTGTDDAAVVGAAAAIFGGALGSAPAEPSTTATETEPAPQDVTVTTVTAADTRSSFEEFAKAPLIVDGGNKRSGLSDLEKVGLVALGALVVGAILKDGREVVANTGDRVVVREPDGALSVYKDDDTLLRRPGSTVRTETYRDGSTRSIVDREDGSQVVTIRDASGRVLRRATYDRNGNEYILIDDLAPETRIDVTTLPAPRPDRLTISSRDENAALTAAIARAEADRLGRAFSLRQIREIKEVRRLAATIDVENITFESGSAVIRTTEARKLADIGRVMSDILAENPNEVFLIEGHTDAVGSAASNLTLSDRRAESVALALTEYFDIPPENMVVQGYGESDLRVQTEADERLNRRVSARLITPLLRTASR